MSCFGFVFRPLVASVNFHIYSLIRDSFPDLFLYKMCALVVMFSGAYKLFNKCIEIDAVYEYDEN